LLFNVESNKFLLALSFLLLVVLLVVVLLLMVVLSEGACAITPLPTRRSWEERDQMGVTYPRVDE
jgi:hypothetical protein